MAERFKAFVLKTNVHSCTGGSNPSSPAFGLLVNLLLFLPFSYMYARLKEHIRRSRYTDLHLHITATRNNLIVCLAARGGYVFGTWSMGMAGLHGYKKTTYASGTLFAIHFGERLATQLRRLKLPNYGLELTFHGLRHLKHFAGLMMGLHTVQIPFRHIRSLLAIPFNGSRRRAKRRV